ncbi:RnfABCDGE type electron transport complex subunit D [Poseidonocella sp. HB161398]|uniref:RnfABCDGE type electron transport complex subunit D n=1 Tax=Poseidonocella sp. HB161398 TaxID=2320855 RepID=UPI00197D6CC4|nr:RnfABCDGE type electron transport complex subunit D [Poseidonocella sp. HB161398]
MTARGMWHRETVAELLLASLLPVALVWLGLAGGAGLLRLAVFLVVAGIWHVIWMLARAQPPSLAGTVTALALAVLAPGDLGLLALILSTSFGVVVAELAFGGWGRNVLNPATVALAFMGFGFPAAPWPELPVQIGWAALPALAIGLGTGIMAPGLVLGALLALGAGWAAGLPVAAVFPAAAGVLALLVADPVASASTRLGRWLNGLLYGGLVSLFLALWTGAAAVQLAVYAALFVSLAAPLCDEIAITLWLLQRKRRHG